MSPEERQLLSTLFDRVRTASTTQRDPEAERFIEDATRQQPYATYYLAQAVAVQEKGLEAAANHIKELEARVRQLEAGAGGHQHEEQGGGFLSSIFGSSRPPQQATQQSPPPFSRDAQQPNSPSRQYDDGYQPPSGPWSRQAAPSAGSSFLHGALGTAAGVAGGMLLANSLSGIFGNHMNSLGWGSPFAGSNPFGNAPVEETVINNYYGDDAGQNAADQSTQSDDSGWQQADDDFSNDQSDFSGFDDSTTDV